MLNEGKGRARFRHELKFIVNEAQKRELVSRFDGLLEKDHHVKNGVYTIRSLYFDDIYNSAYEEKIMGVENRKKYRLRCYDYSPDVIKLECKNKQGGYIFKEAANLTIDEVNRIIDGDYDFLFSRSEEVCKKFYYECMTNFLHPKVIVDYERVPYVFSCGDVRITFDSDIREAIFLGNLFEQKLPSFFVMKPGELVMEVKFTQLIPEFIKYVLEDENALQTAASKYVLCLENKMRRIM